MKPSSTRSCLISLLIFLYACIILSCGTIPFQNAVCLREAVKRRLSLERLKNNDVLDIPSLFHHHLPLPQDA